MPYRRDSQKIERKLKTRRVKKINGVFLHSLWISFVIVFVAAIFPTSLGVCLFLFYPIAIIILIQIYKNDDTIINIQYFFPFLLVPCLGLYIMARNEYQMIDSGLFVWIISATIAGVLWYFAYPNKKVVMTGTFTFLYSLVIAFLFFTYGLAVAKFVNAYFDKNVSQYKVKIYNRKTEGSRRSKTYWIRPEAWGPSFVSEFVAIDRPEYEKIHIGDTITIQSGEGFLKGKWYRVSFAK